MSDPILKALGQRIRELRDKRGFSQESFADHCGVHRTFIGTIERGETNLSFRNLAKMAAGLEITIAKLVAGVERRAAKIRPASTSKREGPMPHAD